MSAHDPTQHVAQHPETLLRNIPLRERNTGLSLFREREERPVASRRLTRKPDPLTPPHFGLNDLEQIRRRSTIRPSQDSHGMARSSLDWLDFGILAALICGFVAGVAVALWVVR